jgi:hypothetical protein
MYNSDHLLNLLKELYKAFRKTGQIACNSIEVENYSRKILEEKLAGLINKL